LNPKKKKPTKKKQMTDLNRIKPAFRTKGVHTGNFGSPKVKSGSTLNDIGVTKAKVVNVTRPQDYEERLQKALRETENPRLIAFIESELKALRVQRGDGLQRVDHSGRTANPFRQPGC
jgi:hypothetical protein